MLAITLFLTSAPVHAEPPVMSEAELEAAKEAARQSIREGEAHQLKSKYWQTFDTPAFRVVVPSYAEPTARNTATGSRWTLDLAGDYMLTVVRPKTSDANQAVKAELAKYPGARVVPHDTPSGRVFHIEGRNKHARLGVHTNPLVLVELTSPPGAMDATVASRVWTGLTVK